MLCNAVKLMAGTGNIEGEAFTGTPGAFDLLADTVRILFALGVSDGDVTATCGNQFCCRFPQPAAATDDQSPLSPA